MSSKDYSCDLKQAVDDQINMELDAFYAYLKMVRKCNQADLYFYLLKDKDNVSDVEFRFQLLLRISSAIYTNCTLLKSKT